MKTAIYCRLSEEDRNKQFETDDSNSIQNQKAMLVQYAMEQGWEVYGIYSDDDYAGADRRRPEFNRLLEDAKARKFDIVLCKTQSRFTRELELVEKYIHGLFPLWGIRFVSIVDNADTALARDCDCHFRFGYGIHSGGHYGGVKLNCFGEICFDVNHIRSNVASCGHQ